MKKFLYSLSAPVAFTLGFILLLISIYSFHFNTTKAQDFSPVDNGVIEEQVNSTISPEQPVAGESVNILLSAYGTNLNAATISWAVNGITVQSGVGMTSFTLTAGKNGEVKNVVATINPASGPAIIKKFTITPQDVSIIYEADGYTPPFYKGKSLFSSEGVAKLIAVPNLVTTSGVRLDPSKLIYKWIIDDSVAGDKSGYGKNVLFFAGSLIQQNSVISVDVSSLDGKVTGRGVFLLTPQNPEVLFYENNPLYGVMFNKDLSSNGFTLKGTEVKVEAFPYSESAFTETSSNLEYSWAINGNSISIPKNQNFVIFRNSSGQSGSSQVSLDLENTNHIFQQVKNGFTINF